MSTRNLLGGASKHRTTRSRSGPARSLNVLHDEERNADRNLYLALKHGRVSEVSRLLESNPSRLNDYVKAAFHSATPLFWASYFGQVDMVSHLIGMGADVNKGRLKDRRPPLVGAAASEKATSSGSLSDCTKVVRLLLEAKARVNRTDKEDQSALLCATSNGNVDMTRLLLEARANPNHQNIFGTRPILAAFTHQLHTLDVVRLLTQFDAEVDITDAMGVSPLNKAQYDLPSVYDFLVNCEDDGVEEPIDDGDDAAKTIGEPPACIGENEDAKRYVGALLARIEHLEKENSRMKSELSSSS